MTEKKRSFILLFVMIVVAINALQVHGKVVLLDGETDADSSAWSVLTRVDGEGVSYLPLKGSGSMLLKTLCEEFPSDDSRERIPP